MKVKFSNPGTKNKIIYRSYYDDKGVLTVVPNGEEDLQARIQADKDACNINLIVKRFQAGDPMAAAQLNAKHGFYGDFRKVPKSYAEFLQMQIDGKQYFERLPAEVRQKYDNDYNQFLSACMTDEGAVELMNKLYPAEVKEEVNSEEVKE